MPVRQIEIINHQCLIAPLTPKALEVIRNPAKFGFKEFESGDKVRTVPVEVRYLEGHREQLGFLYSPQRILEYSIDREGLVTRQVFTPLDGNSEKELVGVDGSIKMVEDSEVNGELYLLNYVKLCLDSDNRFKVFKVPYGEITSKGVPVEI